MAAEIFANIARGSISAAILVILLGGIALLVIGFAGPARSDWVYRRFARRQTDRFIGQSLGVLVQVYGSVVWSPKVRRLVVRGRARTLMSVLFVAVAAFFLLLALLATFIFQVIRTGSTSPSGVLGASAALAFACYLVGLGVVTWWGSRYHSDENLALSSFYLLKYLQSGRLSAEPESLRVRHRGAGLQRVAGILGQLALVAKSLDQFEAQAVRDSALRADGTFMSHVNKLRFLISDASESVVAGGPALPRKIAIVAYRCSEIAATGKAASALSGVSELTRVQKNRWDRAAAVVLVALLVGLVAYVLIPSENSSKLSAAVGFFGTLVTAVLGMRELVGQRQSR